MLALLGGTMLTCSTKPPYKPPTKKPTEEPHSKTIAYFGVTNDEVIAQIKDATKAGQKVGLVIGRIDEEPLPSEEGWVWVSLDIEPRKIIPPTRLHLVMDINEPQHQKKLQNLFNKVVVDASVLKFLHNKPWERLRTLLQPLPESTLITVLQKEMHGISTPYKEFSSSVEDAFFVYNYTLLGNEDEIKKLEGEFIQATQKYLEKLFTLVEIKRNEQYPTRSAHEQWKVGDFFVMTGPKPTT